MTEQIGFGTKEICFGTKEIIVIVIVSQIFEVSVLSIDRSGETC